MQFQYYIGEEKNQESTEQSYDMQEVFFDSQNDDNLDKQVSQILDDIKIKDKLKKSNYTNIYIVKYIFIT